MLCSQTYRNDFVIVITGLEVSAESQNGMCVILSAVQQLVALQRIFMDLSVWVCIVVLSRVRRNEVSPSQVWVWIRKEAIFKEYWDHVSKCMCVWSHLITFAQNVWLAALANVLFVSNTFRDHYEYVLEQNTSWLMLTKLKQKCVDINEPSLHNADE